MNQTQGEKSRPKLKYWLILLFVVLLVAAILLPPLVNIGRYQRRIATSISTSIGRPIHLSEVELRLLPRPGFEISNFSIDDDPTFGNEPLLRAPTIVAYLRLSSLWKGRLDIDRISLDEANLNIVHLPDGRWNLGSLLLKASQTPTLPTAEKRTAEKPRFPYISASNSRINFKQGIEKLPFSFLNADLAVWLDRPDQWGMRFEAQPVRTDLDLDLADTGTVHFEGSFQRASQLRTVPLRVRGTWTKAQLGQLSRLLLGTDSGWRGNLSMDATITGTGENAELSTRLQGDSVHRTEFEPEAPLDFDANCKARFLHTKHALREINCDSPIGKGRLHISGDLEGLWSNLQPSGHVELANVPAEATLDVVRTMRSDFAPDMKVAGSMSGELIYTPGSGSEQGKLEGQVAAEDLQFSGGSLSDPISIPKLVFAAAQVDGKASSTPVPALRFDPFALSAGEPQPLKIGGQLTGTGFALQVNGPAKIDKLLELAHGFGISSNSFSRRLKGGMADLALTIHGPWVGPMSDPDHPVAVDMINGTAGLKNSRFTADFLAIPVEIAQAKASFNGNQVSWDQADLIYGALRASGGLDYSFPCSPKGCNPTFHLHFADLDAETTQAALLGAEHRGTLVKELLSKLEGKRNPWPTMSGTIDADTLTLDKLALHQAHAEVALDGNTVQLKSLDGHTLGGIFHTEGEVQLGGEKPVYTLKAELSHTNAAEGGELFHQKWGAGQINLSANLSVEGFTLPEFTSSAKGDCHWEWTKGAVAADLIPAAMNRFDTWTADGDIKSGTLTITTSQIKKGKQGREVKGKITLTDPPRFAIASAAR